jgi:hypothetical protein
VASKSAQEQSASPENVEELLDTVDKTLDRVKTLYEQYFLGIQKQPPTFLHTDIERKLRDLTQLQIRNTGLRYRLATLQQKFGSYNSYWKRTLRQIENGKYVRNLSKIGREAVRTGAEIPEEILAAMPKRMREQIIRDREQAIAIAERRKLEAGEVSETVENEDSAAMISESAVIRQELKTRGGAHVVDETDGDFDIDAFFDSVVTKEAPGDQAAPAPAKPPAAATPAPAPKPAPAPAKPIAPTQPIPRTTVPIPKPVAPSQVTRPNPITPGAAAARGPVAVEQIATAGTSGHLPPVPAPPRATTTIPIPKITQPVPKVTQPVPKVTQPTQPIPKPPQMPTGQIPKPPPTTGAIPKPAAPPAQRPPPGMTEADVNVLYQNYVQANQAIGKSVGPDGRAKLLKTMNAQAPKIMEQYKAKGVDFTVVVKDNQVVLRAKPKT